MNRETITSVSSGTVDIAAFVRARLDEWEQLALATGDEGDRDWSYEPGAETVRTESGDYVACGPWDCDVDKDYALHIVTHDPAAVLRQVKALRAVVAQYEAHGARVKAALENSLSPAHADERRTAVHDVLRALASIWSDHPDYDPAWAGAAADRTAMPIDVERLTETAWSHYRMAESGGYRLQLQLHMTPEAYDQLAVVARYPGAPGRVDSLFGIPIVVEHAAAWDWQLRQGDQVIESWPPQPAGHIIFGDLVYPVVDWVFEYEWEPEAWTPQGYGEHPPTTGPAYRIRTVQRQRGSL